MRKSVLPFLLFSLVIPMFLCSFVDPDSSDTFSGTIVYSDTGAYAVTHLSGDADFCLSDNSVFVNNSSGFLLNNSPNTVTGIMSLNGTDYNIRFQSRGELQVEQTYFSGTTTRTTYINYHLRADLLPSSLTFSELTIVFVAFVVIILVGISLIKGFI